MPISSLATIDVGGAEDGYYGEVFRGQADWLDFRWVDANDAAVDITGWEIKAMMEFYQGNPPPGGGPAQELKEFETPVADLDLSNSVTIRAQTGNDVGVFDVAIPANAWSADIPINATENVPIGKLYIRIRDHVSNYTIDEIVRVEVAFRHAPSF